jgi:16S rRNA (uracil1498-N3)-methyltransferase
MNSLIVYAGEGWQGGCITLLGDRARAARESSSCEVGSEVRVALFGGEKGVGKVRESCDERIVLDLVWTKPSLSLRPIDLVVGLSRPQTTKKVIQAAVMSGVRSLHLVHLDSGEKSYLDAHLLEEVQLRQEVAKALEQTWEGLYPVVVVHRHFSAFIRNFETLFPRAVDELRVVAHPGAAPLSNSAVHLIPSAIVAVGSEGGWSQRELEALFGVGFQQVGLGDRIVRVEVALLYLLGQLVGISQSSD